METSSSADGYDHHGPRGRYDEEVSFYSFQRTRCARRYIRALAIMSNHEPSQLYARIGGLIYLINIAIGFFGEAIVRGKLIVPLDAAATAMNILGSEGLFRIGLASEILTCAGEVALAAILYVLLRPVSRNLALLAAFFRLIYVDIYGVAKLFEIAALAFLGSDDYLRAFQPQQLHALAYISLRLHGLGYGVSLLFFGFCCVLLGYLVYKSGYLPRIIGALLIIAGFGYALYSLSQTLSPSFTAKLLFPWLLLPGFVAELGFTLWLLIMGIDTAKWREKTEESAT